MNLRPPVPQTGALTGLRHAPMDVVLPAHGAAVNMHCTGRSSGLLFLGLGKQPSTLFKLDKNSSQLFSLVRGKLAARA